MRTDKICFLNEIGAKKNQEDYIFPQPGQATLTDRIFIVCDGVGGSEAGEMASRIVAEHLGKSLQKMNPENININRVNLLLSEAQKKLKDFANSKNISNLGTTFTLLVLRNKDVSLAWCGDSRIYHIRKGKVLYKTSDHSVVNFLIKSGKINEEEARHHPQKNIILKAIQNTDDSPKAEGVSITDIKTGDYFLLCSDGLLENIGEKELALLLDKNIQSNLETEFNNYCKGKTRDNYSMYLLRVNSSNSVLKRRRTFLLLLLVSVFTAIAVLFYFIYPSNLKFHSPTAKGKKKTEAQEHSMEKKTNRFEKYDKMNNFRTWPVSDTSSNDIDHVSYDTSMNDSLAKSNKGVLRKK